MRRRTLLAAAIIILTGCAPTPAPYLADDVRAQSVPAGEAVAAIAEAVVPVSATVLATTQVDRCADVQDRGLFLPDEPVFGCTMIDATVVSFERDDAEAAAALVVQAMVDGGIDAMPFAVPRATAIAHRLELGRLTQQTRIEGTTIWVTSTLVMDAAAFGDVMGNSSWGQDAVILDATGASLITPGILDSPTISCDCLQWWLVVEDFYARGLEP